MKPKFFLIFLAVSSLLYGCASSQILESGIKVPGETKIILKNLAAEYNAIGDGYMGIKNYTKAVEYYKKAMRNKELYLSVSYKLARAYALGKNYDKAIDAYGKLLSLDKDNFSLKLSLAYIYAVKGDYDTALAKYKILMEENPYDESILENYITLLINVGRAEDAEKCYFVMKEKFPDNSQLSSFAQKLSGLLDDFNPDYRR